MAHEIARVFGKDSMAFVGETPWHGLGQRLTAGAPLSVWTTEAGMDWEALQAVPHYTRADGFTGRVTDKSVIYRSDTGEHLSVMGARYQIVQPREVLGFFDSLIKNQGFELHTAGVLFGGRKMWALAKNGHAGEVVKGDKVRQFLMLSTSLDGSSPTTAAFTQVRIVCANTLRVALRELDGKPVRVSHRSAFDAQSVKAQLGLAGDTFAQFLNDASIMAASNIELAEARDVLRGIFGKPVSSRVKPENVEPAAQAPAVSVPATASAGDTLAALLAAPYTPKDTMSGTDLERLLARGTEREQKSVARILELFTGAGRGSQHPGVAGTRWGLLNAITEHVDHELGRTVDARWDAANFGRGDAFKQTAFETLRLTA